MHVDAGRVPATSDCTFGVGGTRMNNPAAAGNRYAASVGRVVSYYR